MLIKPAKKDGKINIDKSQESPVFVLHQYLIGQKYIVQYLVPHILHADMKYTFIILQPQYVTHTFTT